MDFFQDISLRDFNIVAAQLDFDHHFLWIYEKTKLELPIYSIDYKAEKKLEQQEISSKNKTKHNDNTRSKLTNEIVAKDTIDSIDDKAEKLAKVWGNDK